MNERSNLLPRKFALKAIAAIPALGMALASGARIAEAKSAKAAVKYQNTPKGKAECDDCRFWIAGKSKTAAGTCQLVAGPISPHGWCMLFNKK